MYPVLGLKYHSGSVEGHSPSGMVLVWFSGHLDMFTRVSNSWLFELMCPLVVVLAGGWGVTSCSMTRVGLRIVVFPAYV